MSKVIDFPPTGSKKVPPHPPSSPAAHIEAAREEPRRRWAQAFRDLEAEICACARMSFIDATREHEQRREAGTLCGRTSLRDAAAL